MRHALSLGLVLFGTWLLLSGIYDVPLMLAFGVGSTAIVVAIAMRMGIVDREGHPIHLLPRVVLSWTWLLAEIMKSNLDVARRVLARSPDISPTLVRLPTRLGTDLGRVTYANWITLTPGTVSIIVEPGELVVHALTREGAASLEEGEMERRVVAFMGESPR